MTLPRPTGPYPTGTTLIHMRDEGRADPLDRAGGKRELMVQLWYPAKPAPHKQLAPYAPPAEAESPWAQYDLPEGAYERATHSRLDAPVRPGRHKVVFFHHGLCAARTDTTAVNEQLASLDYVVVALGNTHESPAVEFPGGRVLIRLTTAFFGKFLCGQGAPVLDHPERFHPELGDRTHLIES